jgi:membrane protease YdiL (CAAX protease family)
MNPAPSWLASAFALAVLVGLPILSALDARRGVDLTAAAVHRRTLYLSVALSLLVVALMTLGVAAWQDVGADAVGWVVGDVNRALIWAIGVTAGGLAVIWTLTTTFRVIGWKESPVALLLMPRNASETRGFLLLSGVAAVCEEYVFRGFSLYVVTAWTGSPWFAAAVVSLSFGLAHGYQKLAGVVRAATLGMLLAVPTIWTGSLFPAIVGHFWINAAIGLGGWRYLLEEEESDR